MVILTGNWRGGGRLLAVDSKEAQQQVAKLKPLDEKDHQERWAELPGTNPPSRKFEPGSVKLNGSIGTGRKGL